MATDNEYEISERTYEWSVKLFSAIRRLLGVNIKMHHSEGQLEDGQIFLFNHFARFETFIPQYLIYQETGAFCRSVAASEFFSDDDALSGYLKKVGAVPNSHPQLLSLLAKEILRGRKVVVFPEGGMVKDRRVMDKKGNFSVYSRTALSRRKHHTGAAVLGLVLDAFKSGILSAHLAGKQDRLARWAECLEMQSPEALLEAALKPTHIVPANITFYPIRIDDNLIHKGAEILDKGMSLRRTEELLIEGNILLKDTDMDIRLGDAIRPTDHWTWIERRLFRHLIQRTDMLENLFDLPQTASRLDERLFTASIRRKTRAVRNQYMRNMYDAVTINQSHLASSLIMWLLDNGQTSIRKPLFFLALYLSIKALQNEKGVHLHRSLKNPNCYRDIFQGTSQGIQQFLRTTGKAELIGDEANSLQFLPKLCEESTIDNVRLENPVAVYANEAMPIKAIHKVINAAYKSAQEASPQLLAENYFDDEVRAFKWQRRYYDKPRYSEFSEKETATESARPFLLVPKEHAALGVVLVHGFLSSPAEVRVLADKLVEQGYPVIGVRLAGHGTSPWDLRERNWEDWMGSLRRGYNILSAYVERIALVGFSTGGALSLLFAAERPHRLAGVCSVSAPVKFRNRNLIFVPLVHGANKFLRWTQASEGIMPFRVGDSEIPHINYRNIPIHGLYQLRRMVDSLLDEIPKIDRPVRLYHATDDPVIDPKSAEILNKKLQTADKRLEYIKADHHGILYQNTGNVHLNIIDDIRSMESAMVNSRSTDATPKKTH